MLKELLCFILPWLIGLDSSHINTGFWEIRSAVQSSHGRRNEEQRNLHELHIIWGNTSACHESQWSHHSVLVLTSYRFTGYFFHYVQYSYVLIVVSNFLLFPYFSKLKFRERILRKTSALELGFLFRTWNSPKQNIKPQNVEFSPTICPDSSNKQDTSSNPICVSEHSANSPNIPSLNFLVLYQQLRNFGRRSNFKGILRTWHISFVAKNLTESNELAQEVKMN